MELSSWQLDLKSGAQRRQEIKARDNHVEIIGTSTGTEAVGMVEII